MFHLYRFCLFLQLFCCYLVISVSCCDIHFIKKGKTTFSKHMCAAMSRCPRHGEHCCFIKHLLRHSLSRAYGSDGWSSRLDLHVRVCLIFFGTAGFLLTFMFKPTLKPSSTSLILYMSWVFIIRNAWELIYQILRVLKTILEDLHSLLVENP